MGIVLTDSVWCEAGEHFYEREPKRGRVPKNCPEHQPQAKPTRRERKIIDHAAEIARVEEMIANLRDQRIPEAVQLDNAAYKAMNANPDDDRLFDLWLRANGRLLNETTALKAKETQLKSLQERSQAMFDEDEDDMIAVEDDDTEDVEDEILAEFEEEDAA